MRLRRHGTCPLQRGMCLSHRGTLRPRHESRPLRPHGENRRHRRERRRRPHREPHHPPPPWNPSPRSACAGARANAERESARAPVTINLLNISLTPQLSFGPLPMQRDERVRVPHLAIPAPWCRCGGKLGIGNNNVVLRMREAEELGCSFSRPHLSDLAVFASSSIADAQASIVCRTSSGVCANET